MLKPFPHQQEALDGLAARRRSGGDRGQLILATGLGKTFTAAWDIGAFRQEQGIDTRVLVLCNQVEILRQNHWAFEAILGPVESGWAFDKRRELDAQFTFATFQSLRAHLKSIPRDAFDYILVDEFHHVAARTYAPVVEYFQPKFLMGASATPERRDGIDVSQWFGPVVYEKTLPQALAAGLLTPVDYRLVADELARMGTLISSGRRITADEVNRTVFIPKRDEEMAQLVKSALSEFDDPRTIVFCRSISHLDRVAEYLPGAVALHSGLDMDDRTAKMASFRNGESSIALVVDVFNEGVDVPEVNVLLFLRPTHSKTIFMQQLGRGLRLAEGKHKVVVMDLVGNVNRVAMIKSLVDEVKAEAAKLGTPATDERNPHGHETIELPGVRFDFDVESVAIADWLDRQNQELTPQSAIRALQVEAQRLVDEGVVPVPTAIRSDHLIAASKAGRTPSPSYFVDHFGSVTAALELAGLRHELSRDYVVQLYKTEIGRQVQAGESPAGQPLSFEGLLAAGQAKRMVSYDRVIEIFGGKRELDRSAGFTVKSNWKDRKEIIAAVKEEGLRLVQAGELEPGAPPTTTQITSASREGRTPSEKHLRNVFGGTRDWQRECGFDVSNLPARGGRRALKNPQAPQFMSPEIAFGFTGL